MTTRPTEARNVDTNRVVFLQQGHRVEFLYFGADQDGWDGHAICRTNGQLLAIPREDLDNLPTEKNANE